MSFYFKKSLGQHFLINKAIQKKIVSIKKITDKFVIEIGPGKGALTKLILANSPKKLIVIEKDGSLTSYLNKFKDKYSKNFTLINSDVLNINFEKFNHNKILIIANLPYNIATTLIIKMIKNFHYIENMILMVQKEVADRLAAEVSSSSYGRISILLQLHAYVKKEFEVSADNFYPQPKVNSAVIQIKPKKNVNLIYEKIDKILRVSFQQRRKTIKNNLKTLNKKPEKEIIKCGINPSSRPQDIKPDDYIKLANLLIQ